jgi:adenylate cyclase class 2
VAVEGQEVEIKIPAAKEQFAALTEDLSDRLGEPAVSLQCDTYFTPQVGDYTEHPYPYKWLSVRARSGRVSINFKHFHPEGAEWHTHADEADVAVADGEAAERLLEALGFEPLIIVRKTRHAFVDPVGFEVALDEVDGLGFYVEIEATRDFGGIEVTRQAVVEQALQLGLDVARADARGYPFRLLQIRRAAAGSAP